jgi:hypothetical protein
MAISAGSFLLFAIPCETCDSKTGQKPAGEGSYIHLRSYETTVDVPERTIYLERSYGRQQVNLFLAI